MHAMNRPLMLVIHGKGALLDPLTGRLFLSSGPRWDRRAASSGFYFSDFLMGVFGGNHKMSPRGYYLPSD
jgi:hypothetical protein